MNHNDLGVLKHLHHWHWPLLVRWRECAVIVHCDEFYTVLVVRLSVGLDSVDNLSSKTSSDKNGAQAYSNANKTKTVTKANTISTANKTSTIKTISNKRISSKASVLPQTSEKKGSFISAIMGMLFCVSMFWWIFDYELVNKYKI